VTEAARKIFDEALALPEQDRLELAEALFGSLSAEDQAQVDEAWRTEVCLRMRRVRSGEVELESWEDVRRAGHDGLTQR